jgi:hypothetical protein
VNALETGIYTALTGDSDLTTKLGGNYIYNQHAPQGQARPYVVFSHSGGGHENITPSELVNVVYLIQAISDGLKNAGEIDDLIKAVLHLGTLTVSGYTNFITLRENEMRMVETTREGKMIYHAGAYYRIRLDD